MTRGDHLPVLDTNPGKIAGILEGRRAFRRAAPDVAADQGERIVQAGTFQAHRSADEEAASPPLVRAKTMVGPARLPRLRRQVAGQLERCLATRAHEVRDAVMGAARPAARRQPGLVITRLRAWFSPAPIVLGRPKTAPGVAIAPGIRRLARAIMRAVLRRPRRPTWGGLPPTSTSVRRSSFGLGLARPDPRTRGSGSTGAACGRV